MAAVRAAGYRAWLAGTWPRLNAGAKCDWAFDDRSKNRSAHWCAMANCGSRTKNRTYRRRHAEPAPAVAD
jgi:predicted RNA-binding Zn ribbon-like protein